jgi:WD40 repeat protein
MSQQQGAVAVLPDIGAFKKFSFNDPLITGHQGSITDLSFSPFLDNVLATASSDTTLKIWVIPQDGLNQDMEN